MSKPTQTHQAGTILPRATLILAKIAEVVHWCLAGLILVGTFAAIIQPKALMEWLVYTVLHGETTLSYYGFDVAIVSADGMPRFGIILWFMAGSVIVLSLTAMIFRNIYLILKTAEGKTWFAKGDTPFQKNIVRMFREIGIFFIAIAIMGLISDIIVKIAGGGSTNGFDYMSCLMGLVFICVSQFFSYGTSLEKDLDGLV